MSSYLSSHSIELTYFYLISHCFILHPMIGITPPLQGRVTALLWPLDGSKGPLGLLNLHMCIKHVMYIFLCMFYFTLSEHICLNNLKSITKVIAITNLAIPPSHYNCPLLSKRRGIFNRLIHHIHIFDGVLQRLICWNLKALGKINQLQNLRTHTSACSTWSTLVAQSWCHFKWDDFGKLVSFNASSSQKVGKA